VSRNRMKGAVDALGNGEGDEKGEPVALPKKGTLI